MTQKGKEKLTVSVITALVTGALAVIVALLTKPSAININLPDGQVVNADGIVALQSENAALRESLTAQANATLEAQTTTHESMTTQVPTTTQRPTNALFAMTLKNPQSWEVNSGEPKDGRGTTHKPKLFVVAGSGPPKRQNYDWDIGRAEYVVNEEYSTLTGTIAPHSDMLDREYALTIWANDRKVYELEKIRNTDKPTFFNVSLDGIEFDIIKIEAKYGPLLLMDFELH